MSTIATIIERVRGRRQEAALEHAMGYSALVRAVASGDEIDADNAADILEIHGKSEDEFSEDCERQARRYQLAEERKRLVEVQASIPGIQSEVDKAQRAFNAAVEKYRPPLNDAANRLRLAENTVLAMSSVEGELIRTVLDPSIAIREHDLTEQLKELHAKLAPIDDDIKRAKVWERGRQQSLENVEFERSKVSFTDLSNQAHVREKRDGIKAELQSVAKQIKELESTADEFRSQLSGIQVELQELHAKKLEA